MINMISNKLALYIAHHASKPQYLKADIEVLQYGIECMINTTCTNLLIFFFCVLSHTLSAGIVWIILFTFFRNHHIAQHKTYPNNSCPIQRYRRPIYQ